ncbi:glycosyltransferase [Paenibacillus chitinolyticus]|uniref:glycosyltransferase n=1 Tax=Paenibacillus chitinolyticus TaxID=79263 RepID=UPI001C48D7EB|nr:glycosyltransferase [Paenibacillus chitinolyticus]
MRIGINLLSLVPGKIGGMEQYIRNLIWYIIKTDTSHQLFLFLTNENFQTFNEYGEEEKLKRIIVQDNSQLYKEINDHRLELWFCPLLVMEPSYVNIPTVVTIPDIQHEFFPEFFEENIIKWRKEKFDFSAKKADAILTLSEFSKKTIVEKYTISEDKVHSIYLDAGKEFASPLEDNLKREIFLKYNLPEEFGFYPANTWPHKNHAGLIEALYILKSKFNKIIHIVLTGSSQQTHDSINKMIKKYNLESQITFLGYIPQDEMPYIYSNASFLVFPSLFEGFGIPLVEAMKTNTPIIASNTGSIPEVVGEAAILFDPEKPEDIAQKIIELSDKEVLKNLTHKGEGRKELFDWAITCENTLKIFNKVIEDKQTKHRSYPLISIITPSYNQGKFIRETIESVLNQDYPNIEYIVIDGGSKDETVDILKRYGEKINWVSEKDNGQADAVNKGILRAKGDFIGWLNSDDTYLPGAIQKAMDFLTIHTDVSMVYGEGFHVKENGEIMERYPTEPFNYLRLAETCFICQPTGFFRKEIFEKVGLLKEDLHLCMDYELWMRIGKSNSIAYIPDYLATSRMYEDNKTLSRRKEVYEEVIATVKKYYGYAPVSWLYGYADYLSDSKRNKKFYFLLVWFIFKYNDTSHAFKIFKSYAKRRLLSNLTDKNFAGRYEDGWVSKIYKQNIERNGKSKLSIKGKHIWPYKDDLIIKVKINDRIIHQIKLIDKGEFEASVELTDPFSDSIELTLIANKTFCPNQMKINSDKRSLAYIIDEIEVI